MKKIAVGSLGEFWYGDYKEPFEQLEGAVAGYPVGVLLKTDEGQLLCPYCPDGKTYDNLGAHAAKSHGLPAKQFKDEVGLLQGSALVSERTRMLNSANAIRLRSAGRLRNRTFTTAETRRGALIGGKGTLSPEALNKTGRCYAQVLVTAKSVLREHGRITQTRMRRHGIHERVIQRYFGTWLNFLRAVGDKPEQRSGVKWTDVQLITALRSVAQEIGHTPTVSDQRRFGMPSRGTYEGHFGSWVEACRRAGIQPNVPSEWARREVTDQETLAVVSGYAVTGTIGHAAKRAGISHQRASSILARFGINPLPQESPLRFNQMTTAGEIARRLAGWDEAEAA
jgi:hypothetical protein